jgi:hypothetical protein
MKKTKSYAFNYIAFFIFISISAFLTAFVYVNLMKDYNNSNNYSEAFTIPAITSMYRPMVRNARVSMNNTANSLGIKLDNMLRKKGLLG